MADEERAADSKAAVEAMKHAKANMATVLERIGVLERALSTASVSISGLKGYIGEAAYAHPFGGGQPRKARELADDAVAAIAKVLA